MERNNAQRTRSKDQEWCHEVFPWLKQRLQISRPGWHAELFECSKRKLSVLIHQECLQRFFPLFDLWDFRVSVVATLRRGDKAELGLVYCQTATIGLRHLGPFLASSRAVRPRFALALSPAGVSPGLQSVLVADRGPEILSYWHGRTMKVATWDAQSKTAKPEALFSRGSLD
jgi:hypothetical protein